MSSAPLHKTFITGFAWTGLSKWLTQGFTWASLFYTARLLSPADFGMIEMAGFVTIVAQVLAEFGLGSAVLQMRKMQDRELNQLHTISLGFGVLSVGLSCAAAPWMASFFRQPALTELVMVNSLGFIVMALQAVPQGLLQRDLDYRRLSLLEAGQVLLQSILLVLCALAGFRYWSFVVSAIGGRVWATGCALYWKPVKFGWPRWLEIRDAMRFGMDVSGARLGGSLLLQADGFVIGRVLGNSPLGIYRLAINLASAPAEKVAQLVMRVTGPLFARMQDDPAQMGRYFFALSDLLCMVLAPLTAGFLVTAPELVEVVLGPKWMGAVEPARWLAAYMSLRSMGTLVQQVLVSLGQTRFFLWISVASFIILPPGFYFAVPHGLGAVAAVWLITSPILLLPQLMIALQRMECSRWAYLKLLAPSLWVAVVMGGLVWFVRGWLPSGWPGALRLGFEIVAGACVYCSLLWVIHRNYIFKYYEIFKRK